MKRYPLLILTIVMCIVISACGGDSTTNDPDPVDTTDTSSNLESDGALNSVVLLDRTKEYPVLGQTTTISLKITETYKNDDKAAEYDLWLYSYSPTEIIRTILFEGYESKAFPEGYLSENVPELYYDLIAEDIYDYSLAFGTIKTLWSRKVTTIRYDIPDEEYLSGVVHESLMSSDIKTSPELINAGLQVDHRDFCAEDISTGEIDYTIQRRDFVQIGDKADMHMKSSAPIVQCDENNVPSIFDIYAEVIIEATSTLTQHYPSFSLRGRTFQDVLEFTDIQTTNISPEEGESVLDTIQTKTYWQRHVGKIAEIEVSCLEGLIGDDNSLCTTIEEVATNVPEIPVL